MKIYINILALAAIIGETNAFFVQAPKAGPATKVFSTAGLRSRDTELRSPSSPFARENGPSFRDSLDNASAKTSAAQNLLEETVAPITVQGGSLRTWSFQTPAVKRAKVILKTEGRPLNANIDLWQGPDNTPQKMGVYIEDGSIRPFCCVIETPRSQNAIAIRNTGQMEFPLSASVEADVVDRDGRSSAGLGLVTQNLFDNSIPETIQGGAIKTYSFDPSVASVQIMLRTDGRPLNARVELLQGPNNNKQVIELYTEDGTERPFFAIIETPGVGNVVRVLNTAPVEFPMTARVEPYMVDQGSYEDVVISDEIGRGWGR